MYEDTTYEVILDRMLDRVSDEFDKREGSVIYDTHSPTAIELQLLYFELDVILQEAYGDTASRYFLIKRAAERGITPYPATNAILKGVFSPADIDVIGQRFNVGELNYIVLEKIKAGEYRVQCETEGKEGNQNLGQMIPIEYIDGLETAELTEVLIPGEDAEDTGALRERYFDSFEEKAFGGNVADYLEKTNAIPGVGSTKVTRVWNGDIRPADMIPNETVKQWFADTVNTLNPTVKTWLTVVYTAALNKMLTVGGTVLLTILNSDYGIPTSELIQTVQTKIDPEQNAGEGYGLAPIGHVVTVKAAEEVKVNVKANITFEVGYNWTNVQSAIDETITAYLLELRKSWASSSYLIVRKSQIETKLLAITGIVDISDTKINGNADNLTLGKYQVPTYGGASA